MEALMIVFYNPLVRYSPLKTIKKLNEDPRKKEGIKDSSTRKNSPPRFCPKNKEDFFRILVSDDAF